MGESTPNIATDMDIISYKLPLGVTASICPFNFPAMIPLWSFPVSVACGNAAILKPSERVPGASMILADLFTRAGAPPGLLNVVHGQHAAVDFICEHPDIKAVSFVGSDQAVRISYFFCSFLFFYLQSYGENWLIDCSTVDSNAVLVLKRGRGCQWVEYWCSWISWGLSCCLSLRDAPSITETVHEKIKQNFWRRFGFQLVYRVFGESFRNLSSRQMHTSMRKYIYTSILLF